MKRINEARALFAAIAVSTVTIAATFGFARLMRSQIAEANLPNMTATANPAEGRRLFLLNCAHCHGDDARGDEGPDLHDLRRSDGRIRELVLDGIKGEMPAFAKKLNDSDVRALTAYLRTLHM
jgi:mono/diheme cytochrome c family protein